MDTTTPQWSSLPTDLLNAITKYLRKRNDILYFRAVCHSFRSAIPLPPKRLSPNILQPPEPFEHRPQHLLKEHTIYAFQPLNKIATSHETSKTWVVTVEELKDGAVRLKDQLITYYSLKENIPDKLPKCINLLDYHVREITKKYVFSYDSIEGNSVRWSKVAVSSCFEEIDDGFVAMALISEKELEVWRNKDKKWTSIFADVCRFVSQDHSGHSISYTFKDIVFHNNKFYVLGYAMCFDECSMGRGVTLHTAHPKSFRVTEVSAPIIFPVIDGCIAHRPKCLVKSFKDLYFIHRYHLLHNYDNSDKEYCTIHMMVFKFDEEDGKWIQVTNGLEDIVFVLDYGGVSFSLSAKEYSGCKGNSIYLCDDMLLHDDSVDPGTDFVIFNLEDGTVGPISAFPNYSNIFWPPITCPKQDF